MQGTSGSHKELVSGGLFTILGAGFVVYTLLDLDLGTTFNMGAGYFPAVLGSILFLLGLTILLKSFRAQSDTLKLPPLRAVALIILSPIIFGVTIRGIGLPGATALSTFVAALASPRVSVPGAAAIAIALTFFCVVVFIFGLGLNLALVGSWIRF